MKRKYDLLITNLLTNEMIVIHNYSFYVYTSSNEFLQSSLLFENIKDFIDNQIPFKVEFNYK